MKDLLKISRLPDAPTLRQIGDMYIRHVISNAPSLAVAARRLGMSYRGLRLRATRPDAPTELANAVMKKLAREGG